MGTVLSSPIDSIVVERAGCHNLRSAVATTQGCRCSHEDSHVMHHPPAESSPFFFSVMDGHGGDAAAIEMEAILPQQIDVASLPPISHPSIVDALQARFVSADRKLRDRLPPANCSGATCTSAFILPLRDDKWTVTLANAGDSRGLVIRRDGSFVATDDHKPENLIELQRIERAGGSVSREAGGPCRVDGNLAVSRAFGDFEYKEINAAAEDQKISCVPDVTVGIECNDGDFVLLCCDGIYDVMTNEECVEFVLRHDQKDLGQLCSDLIHHVLKRGSKDNCTAMICHVGEKAVEQHKENDARHRTTTFLPSKWQSPSGYTTSMLLVGSVPEGQEEYLSMMRDKFETFHSMFGFAEPLPAACSGCDDVYKGMRLCSRCLRTQYCSHFCQERHWRSGHKEACVRKSKNKH